MDDKILALNGQPILKWIEPVDHVAAIQSDHRPHSVFRFASQRKEHVGHVQQYQHHDWNHDQQQECLQATFRRGSELYARVVNCIGHGTRLLVPTMVSVVHGKGLLYRLYTFR